MARINNYTIQAEQAKRRFLTYDQAAIIRKFRLKADSAYLYPVMLGRAYRVSRATGDVEKRIAGQWVDGNSFEEVMTLLDMLCDARADRHLSGRWKNMQSFGLLFHRTLLEDQRDPTAERFDREPEVLRLALKALNSLPFPGADIGGAVELFDGLRIAVQFWHADEEFAPRLRYLWDENALQYIRYETMYYAVSLLKDRLTEKCE